MSIFDHPSPWTPETIFNRLCRSVERPFMHKLGDRSVVQKAKGHPLATVLAGKVNELDGQIGALNEKRAELSSIFRSILNEAPVFYFDLPVIQRIGAFCSSNPQDLIADPNPRLPFDAVVLANPYNAILLFDGDDGQDRHAWVEGASWRCKFLAYYQEPGNWFAVTGAASLLPPDPISLARCIDISECGLSYSMTESDDAGWAGNLSTYKGQFPKEGAALSDIIRQSVSMALDACRYIDQPRHHLVMEEPRNWKPRADAPKIPRAQDRPRVRIVEPEEVKRIYPHHSDNTGRTVTPHARRGHIKTLRHPRYKEAQGKRIIVRPTWVGDPEWEHRGTKYKVVYRPDRITA